MDIKELNEELENLINSDYSLESKIDEVMNKFAEYQPDYTPIGHHVVRIFDFKHKLDELANKTDREVGDILYGLGYPVAYNPFGFEWDLVCDKKVSNDEFNTYLKRFEALVDSVRRIQDEY